MTDEVHPAWWKPWNWSWAMWGFLTVLMLASIPFVLRSLYLSSVPDMPEPFDVAAFVGEEIPPAENAFTDYRLAVPMLPKSVAEPQNYDDVYRDGWQAADEGMQAWMEAIRPALAVWRRGTEKQRALDQSPDKMTFATTLNEIQELRRFVRVALVDQMRCLHESDYDEAWKLARAAYRCGGHCTWRGVLIQSLVGIAVHASSTAGMQRWAEHPAVTSEQLRTALAHVRADYALYESESNTLRAEYLALRNTMSGKNWAQLSAPAVGGPLSDDLMPEAVMRGFMWVIGEPELTVRIARQIMVNQTREVDKSAADRSKKVGAGIAMLFDVGPNVTRLPGELDVNSLDNGIRASLLSKLLLPAVKAYDNAHLRFRARQAALEVMLAAQAYQRDKGEFPESLDQLVPQYLEEVPLDPTNRSGGRILYRRDSANSAVVWGVAEDGNDDGGVVESESGRPADVGFLLKVADPK